ncbi:MAG: transporter substrate-binding domain-containing protein, partial [Chlamydiia bacterium]|nr:transporter substrate-binding domain-containing protein [Chlamydiia bacterium]
MYKTGKILLAIVVVLGLVGVYRACSTSAVEKRVWKIARDRDWREVRVPGMRRDFLGFSDELIRAIAKEKRLSVEFYGVSFNNLNWVLEKQTYDAILTNLPPSSINRQKFLFSEPYYLLGPILVTRVDQEVESIDDM